MPDWSYQTLFRPLLFRLPGKAARGITLGAIGALSRMPWGSLVIRTLGHMEPSPVLESKLAGITLPTPVGLAGTLDPSGTAHRALAQFGFGYIELGPLTVQPVVDTAPVRLNQSQQRIIYPSYYSNEGASASAARVARPGHKLPQFARITTLPGSSPQQAFDQLSSMLRDLGAAGSAGFYIDALQQTNQPEGTAAMLNRIAADPVTNGKPLFLYVPHDMSLTELEQLLHSIDLASWAGAVVGETARSGGILELAPQDKASCGERLALIRTLAPEGFVLKASCGIYEPQDALDLIASGADYVLLHGGLVFAGPGLPKRVNEAILHERLLGTAEPEPASFWRNWGWMCLLGIAMIIGGILAWIVASTTVLLPYDEAFLGMSRDTLHETNHRMLHFMSHDRITLAGTMISIGVLYFQLSRHGARHGLHWAKTALLTSAIVGFSSFFLYLGYGYFDPLHATVAALLLPMFLLSLRNNPDAPFRKPVNLHNDRVWNIAIWGQFCFVVLGVALVIGSVSIAAIGVTRVFVPEDLTYLGMSVEQLNAIDPRVIPVIAHDRAGFGGALLSDALALLMMSLWGIQQGERWIWQTYLAAGAPPFIAVFSVHLHIGYIDLRHLSPAIFALLLYVAGLVLLYPYLMGPRPANALHSRQWNQSA